MPLKPGKLWIVATPIGNIDDFPSRGRHILENADLILAEDSRRAIQLCKKLKIPVKNLESYFEHNEEDKIPGIIQKLQEGAQIALITDAGTPLLADPGYRLVKKCREAEIEVSAVPGPSAPITALSISGLPPIPFSFLGFLPRAGGAIRNLFQKFSGLPGSLVFFERKNRLQNTLKIALEVFGERQMAICRELTKIHEQVILTTLKNFQNHDGELPGELTIIIGPGENAKSTSSSEIIELFKREQKNNLKPREIARKLSISTSGWTISQIYKLINKE